MKEMWCTEMDDSRNGGGGSWEHVRKQKEHEKGKGLRE